MTYTSTSATFAAIAYPTLDVRQERKEPSLGLRVKGLASLVEKAAMRDATFLAAFQVHQICAAQSPCYGTCRFFQLPVV